MEQFLRRALLKALTGEREFRLSRGAPSREVLREQLAAITSPGLYLHIPFCEQICPYCPYNKEVYQAGRAREYLRAMKQEIDFYAGLLDGKPVLSLYIGGGTPTTLLPEGLPELFEHLRARVNLQCETHLESHPNHLSEENLDRIQAMGVQHLSIGVESLVPRHLEFLRRPYTVEAVTAAVARAMARGFRCVNVDIMFALPRQTYREVEETGRALVELGVDQVAAYPLFRFPYTPLGKAKPSWGHVLLQSWRRRKMLAILEALFYDAGYERSSVWAFTKRGVPRYCSVTVPAYLGLGASGSSYLRDLFFVNTFDVAEYIRAMDERGQAAALSLNLRARMQRAGWLYWRIYETRFLRGDYRDRFGSELTADFKWVMKALHALGFLAEDGERVVLSDRGSFWLHACEDLVSIDYIGKLWGSSKCTPWPEQVIL